MPTTSNFGWTTPADTDLVKDGAAAIRTLGNGIDTSLVDLKGGTTGQVLSKTSNTDLDFTWSDADPLKILDAKGDLISATAADAPARLASSGINNQILTIDTSTSTGLKWANNPTPTWTQRLAPLGATGTFRVNAIASDGTAFVAVGEDGYLYESSNGTTWTSRTSGFGANDIDAVAFGNGLWVAVGQNGTISTSTDRVTWTTRTSNMSTNNINYVAYINSNWVAVGAGGGTTNTGGVTYSSDGITWTRVNQSLTVGTTYNSVIWNGTNYIVGANTSTNNYIYSATLGGTWTAASYAGSTTIEALYFDGSRTIIAGGTVVRYTTGTDLSSTTLVNNFAIGSGDNHNELYLYSGRIYYLQRFIASISTTPAVAGYLNDTGTAFPSPGSYPTSTTITSDNNCIWVGSQGIIVGGSFGQLYTNF